MLSIVIPVYNYPILPLVEQLHLEASSLNIPFEIVVCDDASTAVFQNESITQLPHTRLLKNEINRHVAYSRNRLLKEAKYPWILLLDADVSPLSATFIQTYLDKRDQGLFFQGGFTYKQTDYTPQQSLRLKYGITIEQHNHLHSCCNLFFNQQKLKLQFDDSIRTYGYEDTLFFLELNKRSVEIIRLNNKVIHHNTDSNETYLKRTQEACIFLATLIKNQTLKAEEVQLSQYYSKLKKNNLTMLISSTNFLFAPWIKRNLLGKNPSMFAFKLFKLIEFHKANRAFQKS